MEYWTVIWQPHYNVNILIQLKIFWKQALSDSFQFPSVVNRCICSVLKFIFNLVNKFDCSLLLDEVKLFVPRNCSRLRQTFCWSKNCVNLSLKSSINLMFNFYNIISYLVAFILIIAHFKFKFHKPDCNWVHYHVSKNRFALYLFQK